MKSVSCGTGDSVATFRCKAGASVLAVQGLLAVRLFGRNGSGFCAGSSLLALPTQSLAQDELSALLRRARQAAKPPFEFRRVVGFNYFNFNGK